MLTGRLPDGMSSASRVVAIGDIHGRRDVLRAALDSIEDPQGAELVLLGDYIDRGPDSRGVLSDLDALEASGRFRSLVLLPGNHDAMLWRAVSRAGTPEGNSALATWNKNDGPVFLRQEYPGWAEDSAREDLAWSLPAQVRRRIDGDLPAWHGNGNLLFVHAGLNTTSDMDMFLNTPYRHPRSKLEGSYSWAWVREPFLSHRLGFEHPDGNPAVVVHGHTCLEGSGAQDLLRASLGTLADRHRIGLDCSESAMALVLDVKGCDFRLTAICSEPEPDLEP